MNVEVPTIAQFQVSRDVPTLITVGQFDGVTPIINADRFKSQFTKSKKVVFNGRGHTLVQFDSCMGLIAAAFIDSPTRELDTTCITTLSSLKFITE
jgi:TAP-like protein